MSLCVASPCAFHKMCDVPPGVGSLVFGQDGIAVNAFGGTDVHRVMPSLCALSWAWDPRHTGHRSPHTHTPRAAVAQCRVVAGARA